MACIVKGLVEYFRQPLTVRQSHPLDGIGRYKINHVGRGYIGKVTREFLVQLNGRPVIPSKNLFQKSCPGSSHTTALMMKKVPKSSWVNVPSINAVDWFRRILTIRRNSNSIRDVCIHMSGKRAP